MSSKYKISLGLVVTALVLFTSEVSFARGAFKEFSNPGQCIKTDKTVDKLVSTRAVARKSQDVWFFSIETIGNNSVGDWSIRFSKNNVLQSASTYSFPPPGGWAVIGAQARKDERGFISFSAQATNVTPPGAPGSATTGEICSVTLNVKL